MSRLSPGTLWRRCAVLTASAAVVVAVGLLARDRFDPPYRIAGASAERGRVALADYGCRTCHTIPGAGAFEPTVGPPLTGWSRRAVIAGELPNTPPNLERWITDPQGVEPGTAMPDTGVPASTARDISQYLYTLR